MANASAAGGARRGQRGNAHQVRRILNCPANGPLIRMITSAEDYKKACDALCDGKTVTVTGLLQCEAKLHHLLQPQNFLVATTL